MLIGCIPSANDLWTSLLPPKGKHKKWYRNFKKHPHGLTIYYLQNKIGSKQLRDYIDDANMNPLTIPEFQKSEWWEVRNNLWRLSWRLLIALTLIVWGLFE